MILLTSVSLAVLLLFTVLVLCCSLWVFFLQLLLFSSVTWCLTHYTEADIELK